MKILVQNNFAIGQTHLGVSIFAARKFAEGDVAAILDSGAYGYEMSSTFNARLQPAEVLVIGKTSRLIRKEMGV